MRSLMDQLITSSNLTLSIDVLQIFSTLRLDCTGTSIGKTQYIQK